MGFHLQRRRLNVGMTGEIGSDQPSVKRPVVFSVGRRMDADKTSAASDEPLEGRLLSAVQDVAGRREEYHDPVLRQRRIRKHPAVLRGVHRKAALPPLRLNRGDPSRDRVVSKAFGSGEDKRRECRRH